MKKALTLNLVFGLLAALLVLTFSTCKKDASGGSMNIAGKWTKTAYSQPNVIQLYEFKSNDSVEFFTYKIDTVTKKILGYNYRSTGKYKIEKSVLTLYNIVSFSNSAGEFVPVAQLVQKSGSETVSYTYGLDSQKNQLLLYFTCPAGYNCIPSPIVYDRLE